MDEMIDPNDEQWGPILDSLVNGIEMGLYLNMGLSEKATEEAIALARKFNIREDAIRKWAVDRKAHSGEIQRDLGSLLASLKRNAMAQRIFLNFVPYENPGDDEFKQN